MENLPKFEVIGAVPEEEKDKARARKQNIFLKQEDSEFDITPKERKEIKNAEYPKTSEQIAILKFINAETNRLMQECGVEPFDIPEKNFHILPKEMLMQISDSKTGSYKSKFSAILLSADLREDLIRFTVVAFHEVLHMKSREIWQLYIDEEGKIKEGKYRAGVRVSPPHKKKEQGSEAHHFSGLDEGIVAWQEKLSFPKLLNLPELAEEKERRESVENIKRRQNISEQQKIPLDEIYWVDPLDEKKWSGVSYGEQRKVLEYVCDEISKELFGDKYFSKEDVLKEFLSANFSGNLIPIARLMKQTFGENGLRVLGMMTTKNDTSATDNVLELLKKMRRELLRDSK